MCVLEADVVAAVDALDDLGVEWWMLGGWGVDALLGEQTRPHRDLDVAVFLSDFPRIEQRFTGFARANADEYPGFAMLIDLLGRRLDLLLVAEETEDGYRQRLASGKTIMYPRRETKALGSVGGRSVRCASPALQARELDRPEYDGSDPRDLALLRAKFDADDPTS